MKIVYSERFMDALEAAPPAIQRAFFKQLFFLERSLRHPSLRAKKYDEARGIWQARFNRNWRFYFKIDGDDYHLDEIRPHPK